MEDLRMERESFGGGRVEEEEVLEGRERCLVS